MKLDKDTWRNVVIVCSIFVAGFATAWALDEDTAAEHLWWLGLGLLWFVLVYLVVIRRKR